MRPNRKVIHLSIIPVSDSLFPVKNKTNVRQHQTHLLCTHTQCFWTDTLENSHPVHHMQIATHPEEPLHFLRTSRPTMLHLCGHFSTSEKAQWSTFLLRSILGWRWRNGHKWRPLFSAYTPLQIHNFQGGGGSWNWIILVKQKPGKSHRCVFFLLILREPCVKPWMCSGRRCQGKKRRLLVLFFFFVKLIESRDLFWKEPSVLRGFENVLASLCPSTPEIKPPSSC